MDLGNFFIFFFDKVQSIINFLLYDCRLLIFGYPVSPFALFIVACVISIILGVFLRTAKW